VTVSTTKFHTYKIGLIFKDDHSIPYTETTFKEITEQVDCGPKMIRTFGLNAPLDFFIFDLRWRGEAINVKKRIPVKLVRTRPGTKKIKVKHERHEFEHYQRLAAEHIKNQLFLERFRNR
jgi:hypothetical protein